MLETSITRKIVLILALFIAFATTALGQKTIAVSTGGNWTFYTDFSTALNQCVSGSSIYLPGGIFYLSQGVDTIDKEIRIIGVGHYKDSTIATTSSILVGNLFFSSGAFYCLIDGIQLTGDIRPTGATNNIDFITLNRCRITGDISATHIPNFKIYECIIDKSIASQHEYSTNLVVEKSIIGGNNSQPNISLGLVNGAVFRNNIFCQQLYRSFYCTFDNNIFLENWTNIDDYCTYRNNLFLYGSQGFSSTSSFNNNIFNQSLSSTFSSVSFASFSYQYDYHLLSNSVGKNSGTDGTDIGIYGSIYPYKPSAVPANPHISTKLIAPSSAPNGTLPVNIRVIAQDK